MSMYRFDFDVGTLCMSVSMKLFNNRKFLNCSLELL